MQQISAAMQVGTFCRMIGNEVSNIEYQLF
jgi:hypothetical protein